MLRLARPIDLPVGRLVALELDAGRVTFPVDVSGGPRLFARRRTRLTQLRFEVSHRSLRQFAATLGFEGLEFLPTATGFHVGFSDREGPLAFHAVPVCRGPGLWFGLTDGRSGQSTSVPALRRIGAALRRAGGHFDEDTGFFRFPDLLRAILADALVVHGFRLPSIDGQRLIGPETLGTHLVLRVDPGGEAGPSRIEAEGAMAPVYLRLLEGNWEAARMTAASLVEREPERTHLRALHLQLFLEAPDGEPEAEHLPTEASAEGGPVAPTPERNRPLAAADSSAPPTQDLGLAPLVAWLRRWSESGADPTDPRFEDALDRFARSEPYGPLAERVLADLAEQAADHAELAFELLSKALARNPRAMPLVLKRLALAEALGKVEAVVAAATQALHAPLPPRERAKVAAASALGLDRLGREDDARRLFRDALVAEPDWPDALGGLATISARAGRKDEAVSYLDRAGRAYLDRDDPSAAARVLRRAGELLASGGDFAAAEERIAAARRADADSPSLVCALARLRVRRGREDAAVVAYEELLMLDAGAAGLHHALVEAALFHLDHQRPDQAEPFVDRLSRIVPGDSRATALRERLTASEEVSREVAVTLDGAPFESEPSKAAAEGASDGLQPEERRDELTTEQGLRSLVQRGEWFRAVTGLQRLGRHRHIADVARLLFEANSLPLDVAALELFSRYVVARELAAAIQHRLREAHAAGGDPRAAAIALARAGALVEDSATLRAAWQLADQLGEGGVINEVIDIALSVVGEGVARDRWLDLRRRAADDE
ncbi:MAG: hypothetical protein AAGF12_08145 [Myxococcota bacterium]